MQQGNIPHAFFGKMNRAQQEAFCCALAGMGRSAPDAELRKRTRGVSWQIAGLFGSANPPELEDFARGSALLSRQIEGCDAWKQFSPESVRAVSEELASYEQGAVPWPERPDARLQELRAAALQYAEYQRASAKDMARALGAQRSGV